MDVNDSPVQNVERTTISPAVLHKIALLTTLSVSGVSRMSNPHSGANFLCNTQEDKGAKIQIKDEKAFVDIYVVLTSNMNVREVSRDIQSRVSRAISEMLGMDVGGVNIHIMDIDFLA